MTVPHNAPNWWASRDPTQSQTTVTSPISGMVKQVLWGTKKKASHRGYTGNGKNTSIAPIVSAFSTVFYLWFSLPSSLLLLSSPSPSPTLFSLNSPSRCVALSQSLRPYQPCHSSQPKTLNLIKPNNFHQPPVFLITLMVSRSFERLTE